MPERPPEMTLMAGEGTISPAKKEKKGEAGEREGEEREDEF